MGGGSEKVGSPGAVGQSSVARTFAGAVALLLARHPLAWLCLAAAAIVIFGIGKP